MGQEGCVARQMDTQLLGDLYTQLFQSCPHSKVMVPRNEMDLATCGRTRVQRRQDGHELRTDLPIVSPPKVEQVTQHKHPSPVFCPEQLYQQILVGILQAAQVHIGEQQVHTPPYPARCGCGG